VRNIAFVCENVTIDASPHDWFVAFGCWDRHKRPLSQVINRWHKEVKATKMKTVEIADTLMKGGAANLWMDFDHSTPDWETLLPFLEHRCFLFLTKTTKERMRQQSMFSSLGRGNIVPKEIQDKDAVLRFIENADQFQRFVNESGFIKLTRLSDEKELIVPISKFFSCTLKK